MTSLRAGAGAGLRWLWHGYLAPGVVTLLSSQWKTGKTTLASVLLARMKAGGSLAGLAVAAGRAVVVSEEPAEQWVRRGGKLDLEEHVGWYCRPFRGRPRPGQWEALLERVAEEAARNGRFRRSAVWRRWRDRWRIPRFTSRSGFRKAAPGTANSWALGTEAIPATSDTATWNEGSGWATPSPARTPDTKAATSSSG